jgi:cytochrome oxidase assembly protein ShyY1
MGRADRYRFARRPRWIASHLLVLVLVAVMIWAGFWQLRRYGERRDLNRTVAERQEAAPVEISSAVSADVDLDGAAVDEAEWRRVEVTGRYDVDGEVMVRNRTQDGRPGVWVLTPLVLDDGTAVAVNRGFVPASSVPDEVPAEAAAPEGEVTVTGLLQTTEARGRFGPTDPEDGTLEVLSRVDLARLQAQVPDDLFPMWVLLEEQVPAAGDVPVPVTPPEPFSETTHLSYAFQWFAFTVIALVGYPMILRRQARSEERRRRRADPPPGEPAPPASDPTSNGRRQPTPARHL